MRYDPALLAAIDNSIKLLNKKKPGWMKQIIVSQIDMSNVHNCILGQLYPNYHQGKTRLELEYGHTTKVNVFTSNPAKALAFNLSDVCTDKQQTFITLTKAWQYKIRKLRKELREQGKVTNHV